jgi:hypothetical protein
MTPPLVVKSKVNYLLDYILPSLSTGILKKLEWCYVATSAAIYIPDSGQRLKLLNLGTFFTFRIVMDLINTLPGNSSVNTVQHATIEEAVFSVSAVTSHNSG